MYTTESFKNKIISIHKNKYNLSKVFYINRDTDIILICNTCNTQFSTKPRYLYEKRSTSTYCPNCNKTTLNSKKFLTNDEFVNRCKIIHGNKYDYSKTKYINSFTPINIFCKICQKDFQQIAKYHISGSGCQKCNNEQRRKRLSYTQEEFLNVVKNIHGDRYSYDETIFKCVNEKIKVKCNKCTNFFFIRPDAHIKGTGCICFKQSVGESKIKDFLNINKIKYEQHKKFIDCIRKRPLSFDFYLPDFNILIEYDGKQHYTPFFNERLSIEMRKKILDLQIESDSIKTNYAKSNNIILIRIPYTQLHNINKILIDLKNKLTS